MCIYIEIINSLSPIFPIIKPQLSSSSPLEFFPVLFGDSMTHRKLLHHLQDEFCANVIKTRNFFNHEWRQPPSPHSSLLLISSLERTLKMLKMKVFPSPHRLRLLSLTQRVRERDTYIHGGACKVM